jgi:hypothetical protein
MMKNTLVIIAFLLTNTLFGQEKTREEVLQLIADDTCICIENDKTLYDSEKTMNQKQMALGLCLLKSYNVRKLESEELKNKGLSDFEALGEEVGFLMANTCGDSFINLFSDAQLGNMLNDDENDFDTVPPPPAPKNENDLNIEVKLASIHNEIISSIIVTDTYDKEHTFIISEQFEGYNLLKKSNIKKDFRIFYKEVEYFDLSERRYVKKKVIKYLEKI